MTTITARIVFSVDAMAKAKGITARHDIDTLVGIATRAMANGDSEILALEAAGAMPITRLMSTPPYTTYWTSLVNNRLSSNKRSEASDGASQRCA